MSLLGILMLLLGLQAPTQSQPATPVETTPDLVFRTTTRLVQVNVVVHDHGKPVTDLKKEDFTVFEKGKQQQISFFSEESLGKTPIAPAQLPPHIFSNQLSQRNDVPVAVTVILLDSLNTPFADQNYARKAVIEFLLQLKPTDHIAIYQLSRRLKILHDYTTDSVELVNRLLETRAEVLPEMESSQGFDLSSVIGGGGNRAEAAFYTTDRALNTLKALEVIAEHLSSVPGRKNLVWLSDGFPIMVGFGAIPALGSRMGSGRPQDQMIFTQDMDRAIRALNDAGVAVYPVDARGLVPPRAFSAENRKAPPTAPPIRLGTSRDTMLELADRTGGRAFYNTNDLKNAVRSAIADSEVTYTIGYHPLNTDLDGKFRDIKVKVDRPGVDVRYRKGYFAMRPVAEDNQERAAEMNSAVWSPLDATALPVNARVDFVASPPGTVHVYIQTDPANLMFSPQNDRIHGKVDILVVQKDDRGNQVKANVTDTLELNLKQETYQKLLKQGLIYEKSFPREARASKLRIIVRDGGSGAIGSLTVPFKDVN